MDIGIDFSSFSVVSILLIIAVVIGYFVIVKGK